MLATASTPRIFQVPCSLSSMIAVFYAPFRAFRRLRSGAPFLLVWVIGAAIKDLRLAGIYWRVGVDAIAHHSLGKMPELKTSAMQSTYVATTYSKMFPLQMVTTPLMWIVGLLIVALVLLQASRLLLRNDVSFRQALSIITYAQMPQIAFAIIACLFLWIHPDPSSIRVDGLLGLNAGLLLPWGSAAPFYRVILGSLDVCKLWSILLVGIGLSCEQDDLGKTLGCVGALWFLYVIGHAGFAALTAHLVTALVAR